MLQQILPLEAPVSRILRKLPDNQTWNVYLNIRYCSPPFKIHYMYYTISVVFRQDCVWQEKDQNEKGHALRDLFRFGSPARACTGMDIEPTTPCNNPTVSASLRQLRKFALSASSEEQTLRSAALRAAAC